MFRIEWLQSALNELARLWLEVDSALRKEITRACHEIEGRLQTDPEHEGESRAKGRRIAFSPPLAVIYRVDLPASRVAVLDVVLMRRRHK